MLSLQASGILGDKAKDHKYKFPMMINKTTPTAVSNYLLKSLEQTNQIEMKVPKVSEPTNKIMLL